MDELTEAVKSALDRAQGAMTDSEFAAHLGTDRMALWRWRNGRYSKAFRTIIPLTVLKNLPLPPGWAEQATDIRIVAPLLATPKEALDKV